VAPIQLRSPPPRLPPFEVVSGPASSALKPIHFAFPPAAETAHWFRALLVAMSQDRCRTALPRTVASLTLVA